MKIHVYNLRSRKYMYNVGSKSTTLQKEIRKYTFLNLLKYTNKAFFTLLPLLLRLTMNQITVHIPPVAYCLMSCFLYWPLDGNTVLKKI